MTGAARRRTLPPAAAARALTVTVLAIAAAVAAAAAAPAIARPYSPGPGAASLPGAPATATPVVPPAPARLLGQRIMVGLPGLTADPALLARVRRGEIGAVILFGRNIASRAQVKALTKSLQDAAAAGGNPPLLIAVDQEGGEVRRFAHGPPSLAPPQMAATGHTATALAQGRATGRYLAGLGINVDLAPVADVPTTRASFLWQQGRAFSFSPHITAVFASAFAAGVQAGGVAAAGKHFPGLGSVIVDSDFRLEEAHPTAAQRRAALRPFAGLVAGGVDMILVSTVGFPAYDRSGAPAALSAPIIQGLLRHHLRFRGVTITDSLASPTGHDPVTAGVLAARAGADVLLYTDTAPGALPALEAALQNGRLSWAGALASYTRIVTLKQRLGG